MPAESDVPLAVSGAPVLLRREGAIAWLTLHRPDDDNAIDPSLAWETLLAIREAEDDPEVSVLVLAGAGRVFCSGGDVEAMAAADDRPSFLLSLAGAVGDIALALMTSRLVVVAAVNGVTAGAGLGLVLASDLVVASTTASFLGAYAGVGLTPDAGVSYLLPRVVGRRRSLELLLGGRVLRARDALEWGIVGEVVEPDALLARAGAIATRLASSPSPVLAHTKRLVAHEAIELRNALDDEVRTIAEMSGSETARHALSRQAARSASRRARRSAATEKA